MTLIEFRLVFYDDFYAADLWGKDLSVELQKIYRDSSEFCIMFISQHYLDIFPVEAALMMPKGPARSNPPSNRSLLF